MTWPCGATRAIQPRRCGAHGSTHPRHVVGPLAKPSQTDRREEVAVDDVEVAAAIVNVRGPADRRSGDRSDRDLPHHDRDVFGYRGDARAGIRPAARASLQLERDQLGGHPRVVMLRPCLGATAHVTGTADDGG